MKKILITGANSYIGTSLEKYLIENWPNNYKVDTIDMVDGSWRDKSFRGYDVVYHVAGIVHKKETEEITNLYYLVNRDLAIEVAKKAKEDGVRQFFFLSTMSVYGMYTGIITKDTEPNPKTNYGKSKLEAEEGINQLRSDSFRVVIMRPPMVYGDGCKGNYQRMIKFVNKYSIFPRVKNKRSVAHISVLNEFVKEAIENNYDGLYFPRNAEDMCTMDMVKEIANKYNKKMYFSFLLGLAVICFRPFFKILKKVFGTLIYKID